jgi:cell division protein FtsB
MLLVVALFNGRQQKAKLAAYQEKEQTLTQQIEEEQERTEEIEELKKYTQTKKYVEEVAREKLGLVYEDEIIIQTED